MIYPLGENLSGMNKSTDLSIWIFLFSIVSIFFFFFSQKNFESYKNRSALKEQTALAMLRSVSSKLMA